MYISGSKSYALGPSGFGASMDLAATAYNMSDESITLGVREVVKCCKKVLWKRNVTGDLMRHETM
jgi:hypothetical protein